MADVLESTESVPTYKNGLMVLPRPPIVRLPQSVIYAGVGVALGILTGAMLGLAGIPGDGMSASVGSAPTSSTGSNVATRSTAQPSQMGTYQPVVYVQPTAWIDSPVSAQQKTPVAPAHRVVRSQRSTKIQTAPASRMREIPTNHVLPLSPAEMRPAKPIAHPLHKPARVELASAPEVIPVPMDEEQMSIDGGAKPSLFYTEGSFTP